MAIIAALHTRFLNFLNSRNQCSVLPVQGQWNVTGLPKCPVKQAFQIIQFYHTTCLCGFSKGSYPCVGWGLLHSWIQCNTWWHDSRETLVNAQQFDDATPNICFSKSDTDYTYLRFNQQCLKKRNIRSVEWDNDDGIAMDVERRGLVPFLTNSWKD